MSKYFKVLCMVLLVLGFSNCKVQAAEREIVDTSEHIYLYEEMEQDILALSQKYPDYITCEVIGTSCDGRNIWQVIVGNPYAEKAIHISAGIHAREWMNCWIQMKYIEDIASNWNTKMENGLEQGLIYDQCALYFIPMFNPDGVTISQLGFEAIRSDLLKYNLYRMKGSKNPKLWKANAAGVDLNRNFRPGWNERVDTRVPDSQFYNGITYNTEPEILTYIKSVNQRSFDLALMYHSMEGAVYWDIGQEGTFREECKYWADLVCQVTGYKLGDKSEPHGLDYNWTILEKGIPTLCIETGRVGCPLPYSQWSEIYRENDGLLRILSLSILGRRSQVDV